MMDPGVGGGGEKCLMTWSEDRRGRAKPDNSERPRAGFQQWHGQLSRAGHPVFTSALWNCSVAEDTGSGPRCPFPGGSIPWASPSLVPKASFLHNGGNRTRFMCED